MRQSQTSRPRLIQAMLDAFHLPDLRQRILITFGLLVVFRFIAHVPLPGVDAVALKTLFEQSSLLGMLDMFSGGAMKNFSIAAMGVYPYITASIIMTLLAPIIPPLQNLAHEGEAGQHKMNVITHWLTVPMAGLSGWGLFVTLERQGVVASAALLPTIALIASMMAGTLFLVWLGEQITEYGIGNGISIIIFAGIVAGYEQLIGNGFLAGQQGQLVGLVVYFLITVGTVALIVLFTEAHRRIPVQYAKTVYRGDRMYRQSGATHIPLRVNATGMIPLIFSMSMVLFPGMIASYFQGPASNPNIANTIVNIFSPNTNLPLGLVYWGLYFFLTVGFAFFYTIVIFQQQDLAGNLQRQGGFVPGIRPGKQTSDFFNQVVGRVTWAGALFLAIVAIVPFLAKLITGVQVLQLSSVGLLIVVGVVLDTMKQMEAQLVMRRYEGFIK
jgi:preprotein translocase subunit SecY